MPLLKKEPKPYQQENWLLDNSSCWKKDLYTNWQDLESLMDPVDHLWINGYKTFHGLNDKIPRRLVRYLESSLRFIWVDKLTFRVLMYQYRGRRQLRVQGKFQYNGDEYRLWVTDPDCRDIYLKKRDRELRN